METKEKASAGIMSPTNTGHSASRGDAISTLEVAVIATSATLLFIVVLSLAGLVLAVVVYRRWRIEPMEKTLLEIHSEANIPSLLAEMRPTV